MKPLTARCRSCHATTELNDIVIARTGQCPSCHHPWSEQWTNLLVEECEAIENLTHALTGSLRRLCGLPGNLELQPDELFANLTSEVPWHQSIDTEPGLVAAELRQLTDRLDSTDAIPASLVDEIRDASTRLIKLATILDANQEATRPDGPTAGAATRAAGHALHQAATAHQAGGPDDGALRRRLHDATNGL